MLIEEYHDLVLVLLLEEVFLLVFSGRGKSELS